MYGGERSALRWARVKRKPRFVTLFVMSITVLLNVDGYLHSYISCPDECICKNTFESEFGYYIRAECFKGDMHKIPVDLFDRNAEVIIISAPKDRPNFLTFGPIFTQPIIFEYLRELHIINSNLPSLGSFSFWGLKNLRVLNVSYNNLTNVWPDQFKGLVSLTDLNFDHNNIDNMPSETFRLMVTLKTLILSHNQISILEPRLFRMLDKLTHLDLSDNPLPDLNPEVFKDIQQLKVFKCRRCLLRRINPQVYHLIAQLEELDLGENQFKYLTTDEFISLKKLLKLRLDGNQLSVIVDYMFGKNRKLEFLSLDHNRLALLAPAALTNLTSLVHLDISYNKIYRFHLQTFSPIVGSLKTINFSGNNLPLNEIAIVLQILPEIYNVGLASLSLDSVPPNFFMFNAHLVGLDLSWNKLTKFPFKLIAKTKYLQRLDLSRNRIESLEDDDLQRLEAISQVDLSGNVWRCDQCAVGTMLVYMKTTVLNGSIRHLTCHSPLRLRGIKFSELTFNVLDPCPNINEAQVSVLAGFMLVTMAVLAAVAAALCCSRHRAAQYYTNEEKRREREHDHQDELLNRTEVSNVATIHAPNQMVPNSS